MPSETESAIDGNIEAIGVVLVWPQPSLRGSGQPLLARRQGADGVDEAPAGPQMASRGGEDCVLFGGQPVHRGRHDSPAQVGMRAQRSEAGAGRVDEHAVELAIDWRILGV